MSRARGKLYDDDDLADYDDDYYEDDGYRYAQKAKAAAPASKGKQTTGKAGAPAKATVAPPVPVKPASPQEEDDFPDSALLDANYDDVANVLGEGSGISEADIVAGLRACNYSAEATIAWLLDGGRAKPKPVAVRSVVPAASPAAPKSTPAKHAAGTPLHASVAQAVPALPHSINPVGPAPLPSLPAQITSALAAIEDGLAESTGFERDDGAGEAAFKPRVAVVTCGHVDAGKSTLMGHMLYELGCVHRSYHDWGCVDFC